MLCSCLKAYWSWGTMRKVRDSHNLTLFRAGGLQGPLQVFACAMAKRVKIFSSYLATFPYYSLCRFQQKIPGQIRSGHQSGFFYPTSEKFAITSELEFFTERFPLFRYSLQYQYMWFEYLRICISVTWGRVRAVTITLQAYEKKTMKCVLLRVSESKLPNSFRIMSQYLICNDPGGISWQRHREGSSEVMTRPGSWPQMTLKSRDLSVFSQ